MHFLSIETSTQNLAIALSRGDQVLAARTLNMQRVLEHSLMPAVDQICASARVHLEALDAFAVGLGPGSFTSLRIGLSTVKAFAMALRKPVVGIGSLDVIAEGFKHADCDEVCVLVDARRQMVYSALYKKSAKGLKRMGKYQLSDLASVLEKVHGRTMFAGDGLMLYQPQIEKAYALHGAESPGCRALFSPERFWFPNASHLAKLAYERLSKGQSDDPSRLVPVYLYAHDCQVDKVR